MNCDQCQNDVGATAPVHLLTEVRSVRICMVRIWAFCSITCRDTWWNEPASEPFREVHNLEQPAPEETNPAFWCDCDAATKLEEPDRDITVFVVHHERIGHRSQKQLVAEHAFDCPCDINRWWTDPQVTVPDLRGT